MKTPTFSDWIKKYFTGHSPLNSKARITERHDTHPVGVRRPNDWDLDGKWHWVSAYIL